EAPYGNKPPLLLWLTALSMRAFGINSFAARLPAAVFVFLALLLLWNLVAQFYGPRAAFFSLLLFCANRIFGRAVVELNFEGMLLCGALCCMHGSILLLRGVQLKGAQWLWFGAG